MRLDDTHKLAARKQNAYSRGTERCGGGDAATRRAIHVSYNVNKANACRDSAAMRSRPITMHTAFADQVSRSLHQMGNLYNTY